MDEARREVRAPVALRVRFRSENLDEFVERYSVDISRRGIFIRTQKPLSVGTPILFEFKLRDDQPLFRGEGRVKWTRAIDPARPGVAPGMGVEFFDLPEESRQVLEEILRTRGLTPPPTDAAAPDAVTLNVAIAVPHGGAGGPNASGESRLAHSGAAPAPAATLDPNDQVTLTTSVNPLADLVEALKEPGAEGSTAAFVPPGEAHISTKSPSLPGPPRPSTPAQPPWTPSHGTAAAPKSPQATPQPIIDFSAAAVKQRADMGDSVPSLEEIVAATIENTPMPARLPEPRTPLPTRAAPSNPAIKVAAQPARAPSSPAIRAVAQPARVPSSPAIKAVAQPTTPTKSKAIPLTTPSKSKSAIPLTTPSKSKSAIPLTTPSKTAAAPATTPTPSATATLHRPTPASTAKATPASTAAARATVAQAASQAAAQSAEAQVAAARARAERFAATAGVPIGATVASVAETVESDRTPRPVAAPHFAANGKRSRVGMGVTLGIAVVTVIGLVAYFATHNGADRGPDADSLAPSANYPPSGTGTAPAPSVAAGAEPSAPAPAAAAESPPAPAAAATPTPPAAPAARPAAPVAPAMPRATAAPRAPAKAASPTPAPAPAPAAPPVAEPAPVPAPVIAPAPTPAPENPPPVAAEPSPTPAPDDADAKAKPADKKKKKPAAPAPVQKKPPAAEPEPPAEPPPSLPPPPPEDTGPGWVPEG